MTKDAGATHSPADAVRGATARRRIGAAIILTIACLSVGGCATVAAAGGAVIGAADAAAGAVINGATAIVD